ncbi:MAG TPA: hypothetical protein VII97_05170 [Anaerolineales bacterium]
MQAIQEWQRQEFMQEAVETQKISSEQIKLRSSELTIPSEWIKRISLLYLLIPFLIFCLGYLKMFISLSIALIFLWLIIKNWSHSIKEGQSCSLSRRNLVFTFLVVLLWVALSGIGGFAFQNIDFHIRNAIFRDLINFDWPVKYYTNPTDPSIPYILTYYIGFWLPAALVGKIAGWLAANITLYVWSVLGILLTLFLLASKIKLTPTKLALLFIFFSGMDGLGTLLMVIAIPNTYHQLWPPIFHLEWWMPGFQYSSFTTQLFWVFNQAIPAWLCMALLYVTGERKIMLLIWSLCCFFAPLPALGMFPYVVLKFPKELMDTENLNARPKMKTISVFFSRLLQDVRTLLSIENILGGGLVLGISLLYFLSNVQSSNGSASQIQSVGWILYVIFVLFEGLILWWIFKDRYKVNLNWYLAGALLIVIPLIKIGNGNDFCMRASIPTLFMLLLWSAETLAAPGTRIKAGLILLLCIGAITPIYEINRSIYRTTSYFFTPPSKVEKLAGQEVNIYTPTTFEFDHPYTLTADSFKSLGNFDPEQITNFLAKSDHTFFETYLLK